MKILLVYPSYPKTYWSFHYALKFISKDANFPPLGLLTVASMLPEKWEKKLVDMNAESLRDKDIKWADYIFLSAMVVQKKSVLQVVERCSKLGKKIVAGGPLFTSEYDEFGSIDHLVLDEAEVTLPIFLEELEKGTAKHIYRSAERADMEKTPNPLWDLIDIKKYASMNIQYSRGCPFNCEFCNITMLYGRVPRTKSREQLLVELESLYNKGWRGSVFFVDDNFIGNKKKLKEDILPALVEWMDSKEHPFTFFTEASIDLSDDEELMSLMVRAGFDTVFVGIETPNQESLAECNKFQNKNRDLVGCVNKIQSAGLQVQGGFIVGFDSDPSNIFERLINFIEESRIVTAMVGVLNAPRGTNLYRRLEREGRIVSDMSGDNTDFSINFITKMDQEALLKGYEKIVNTIYSPKHYYSRVKRFLEEFSPLQRGRIRISFSDIRALFRSIIRLGIIGKERVYYWKLVLWSLVKRPRLFPMAITFSIYGFHFRKIFEDSYT